MTIGENKVNERVDYRIIIKKAEMSKNYGRNAEILREVKTLGLS